MSIPLHKFKQEQDIPFEIVRIENIVRNELMRVAHHLDFYVVYWITQKAGAQYIDSEVYLQHNMSSTHFYAHSD